MAITPVNLTGNIGNLVGAIVDPMRTKVWIITNIDGDQIIDADGKEIRLGNVKATVEADGRFTFTGLAATNSATQPTAWQYRVHIDYPVDLPQLTNGGKNKRWSSDWFPLTSSKDLSEVVGEVLTPPNYRSDFTAQMDAIKAQAAAARAGAEQAKTDAQNLVISDLGTTDGQTRALIEAPASQTARALSASYGTVVPLARLGGGPDKTPAENQAALQAGIDAGLAIFVPPGITQVSGGLVPKHGMRIVGFGKGYPDTDDTCSILRTVSGPLFLANTESGDGFTNFASFQNVDLQAAWVAQAPMMVGEWASTEFRNVRLRQYNPDHPVVDVTGWIDVTIDGASEITGPATTPHPLFRAVTDASKIAQSAWRDIRVTGGENYQFWIEATGGDALDYAQGLVFDNINHEIPHGGGIKLLSCRGVTINACGSWDRDIAAPNDFIYLGAGSANHPSGAITISNCVRDASANPPSGTYDIKAEPGTFDLFMVNNGVHQGGATGWRVDAGGATGQIVGTIPAIFDNGENIRREVGAAPTLAVNMVADPLFATDLDSDLWLAIDQTPTSVDGVLTMTGTAAAFTVQTFAQAQRALAPCLAGVAYRVSAEVRAVGADKFSNLAVNVYADATGASLVGSADVSTTATAAEWTPLSVTITPDSDGVLSPQLGSSLGVGTQAQWRNLHVEPTTNLASFIHGGLPGCYWEGEPNRSPSRRAHAATTSDLPGGSEGIHARSADGTLYKLVPPNGGGAAVWIAV